MPRPSAARRTQARRFKWPGNVWGATIDSALRDMLAIAPEEVRREAFQFVMQRLVQQRIVPQTSGAALHEAIDASSNEVVEFLLDLDCTDPNEDLDGRTPLIKALEKGNTTVVHLMLDMTAERRRARARECLFWLQRAASKSRCGSDCLVRVVELPDSAVEHIAAFAQGTTVDLNRQDVDGRTPLHVAVACTALASQADAATVHLSDLLRARAFPSAQNKVGWTPLHFAASYGLNTATTMLLAHNADPAVRDRRERTAIHYAVENKQGQCALILLTSRGTATLTKEEEDEIYKTAALPGPWRQCLQSAIQMQRQDRAAAANAKAAAAANASAVKRKSPKPSAGAASSTGLSHGAKKARVN